MFDWICFLHEFWHAIQVARGYRLSDELTRLTTSFMNGFLSVVRVIDLTIRFIYPQMRHHYHCKTDIVHRLMYLTN